MGSTRQHTPARAAHSWVAHSWVFLFALAVFGGFWLIVVPEAEIRWAQYLLGAVAMVGAILSARFALTGTLLTAVATAAAWALGVTEDPFLLTSLGVFSVAESRGSRRFPWWIGALWALLVLSMFVADTNEADTAQRLRTLLMAALLIAGAWVIGVRTRQVAEAAARQSSTEERLRLARDVHDVLSHSLGTIGVRAGVAAHITTLEEPELRKVLGEIEEHARGSLTELKTLLQRERDGAESTHGTDATPGTATTHTTEATHTTAPPDSPASPLSALLQEVAITAERTGLAVELRVPAEVDELPALARTTAHRVVQEAVTNAIRHASATALTIEVLLRNDEVRVRVADNGGRAQTGFREGHGLTGMRERVALAGGGVRIAHDQAGFSVMASFPGTACPVTERGVDRV